MRMGFTGSRAGLTGLQIEQLWDLLETVVPTEFHHGMCKGADIEAGIIVNSALPECRRVGWPGVDTNGRPKDRADCTVEETMQEMPFLVRNREIAQQDLLVACPSTREPKLRSGTWATIRYARECETPLVIIYPDGEVYTEGGMQ